MAERRPTLGLIGPGRAGTAVARALTHSGWVLSAVAGSSPGSESAAEFAGETGACPVAAPIDVAAAAEVVLIAVPDSSIRSVALALAEDLDSGESAAWAFGHLSGSLPVSALAPLASRGKAVFGLHPVLPLAGRDVSPAVLEGAPVAVAGDGRGVAVAHMMAQSLGAVAFEIADADRAMYHAACALASNALVALESAAFEAAEAAGVEDPAGILIPLVRATVDNLAKAQPQGALTGPVARGDVLTVEAHLEALDRFTPALSEIYRVLSMRAVDLADGLDEAARRSIVAVLEGRRRGDAA